MHPDTFNLCIIAMQGVDQRLLSEDCKGDGQTAKNHKVYSTNCWPHACQAGHCLAVGWMFQTHQSASSCCLQADLVARMCLKPSLATTSCVAWCRPGPSAATSSSTLSTMLYLTSTPLMKSGGRGYGWAGIAGERSRGGVKHSNAKPAVASSRYAQQEPGCVARCRQGWRRKHVQVLSTTADVKACLLTCHAAAAAAGFLGQLLCLQQAGGAVW